MAALTVHEHGAAKPGGILVVNAGSSSLKFQIFDVEGGTPRRRVRGQVDGIGVHPRLRATDGAGATLDHLRTHGAGEAHQGVHHRIEPGEPLPVVDVDDTGAVGR